MLNSLRITRRAAAPGYGVGILLVTCMSMLVLAMTMQLTTGSVLPKQLQAMRQKQSATTVARAALPIARAYLQTQLNNGVTVDENFSLTGQTITAPSDPNNLASAPMTLGTYSIAVTRKNGDYYLLRIDATVGGTTDSETIMYKIVPQPVRNLRFMGRVNGDQSGESAVTVGDVDGDGYDDMMIGARYGDAGNASTDNRGEAYLIFGRDGVAWNSLSDTTGKVNLSAINGVNTGDNNMIRFIGRMAGDENGASVSSAGDVDKDGYDDLLIAAARADGNSGITNDNRGEVYLVFGRSRADWNSLTNASGDFSLSSVNGVNTGDNGIIRFIGRTSATWTNIRLAAVGDVDGYQYDSKTYDDFVISFPHANNDTGEIYLILGRPRNDALYTGYDWNELTTAAGDVSLTAANVNGSGAGEKDMLRFVSRGSYTYFGQRMAGGDVNNDGYNDLILAACSAEGNSPADQYVDKGEAYLVFGRSKTDWDTLSNASGTSGDIKMLTQINGVDPSLATENKIIRFIGRAAGDELGEGVAIADVDGDNYDDLMVGAFWADPDGGSKRGETYIIFGRSIPDWHLLTDVNGDVTLNAATANGVDTGDKNIIRLKGRTDGSESGTYVASGGDVDGDGYQDLLIGAPYGDDASADAGEAYLVLGRPRKDPTYTGVDWNELTDAAGEVALLTAINGIDSGDNNIIKITGRVSSDLNGLSISMNHDLNNDGKPDIVISSFVADAGGSAGADRGEIYVIFGRSRSAWDTLTPASGTISLSTVFP